MENHARIAVSWPTYPTPTSALATVLPSLHQSNYLGIFLYICCYSASTHTAVHNGSILTIYILY